MAQKDIPVYVFHILVGNIARLEPLPFSENPATYVHFFGFRNSNFYYNLKGSDDTV
jgi:hypothetical protein